MKISKIHINNFKSFDDVSVDLNNFNVIVGESASGKSNFIKTFKFLKDICENLKTGINLHGGPFIKNFKHGPNEPFCINATFEDSSPFVSLDYPISDEDILKINYKSFDYELCINYSENKFDIVNEEIKFNFEIYDGEYLKSELLSENTLILKCLIS